MLTIRMHGLMARRMLVNYRVPVDVAQRVLPPRLRPNIIHDASGRPWAVAGLCLVRLEQLRPRGFPAFTGSSSENLATRMGVVWDDDSGITQRSVFIFQRHTASAIGSRLSERINYGLHQHAHFVARDQGGSVDVRMEARDGRAWAAAADSGEHLSPGSVFRTIADAIEFFGRADVGYSPARTRGLFDGARLTVSSWPLQALHVHDVGSTLLEQLFHGTAVLDSAFIMRNIHHEWTPVAPQRFGESEASELVAVRKQEYRFKGERTARCELAIGEWI